MRTNANITVYNKYVVGRAEQYQRTQIGSVGRLAVAWEDRKASNILATGGQISADQARIFIPLAEGTNHLDPRAWQALVDKSGKWTLQVGDVVVKGLVSNDIVDADPDADPPVAAFSLTMLKALYDNVLVISSVDAMMSGSYNMRHWLVGAK